MWQVTCFAVVVFLFVPSTFAACDMCKVAKNFNKPDKLKTFAASVNGKSFPLKVDFQVVTVMLKNLTLNNISVAYYHADGDIIKVHFNASADIVIKSLLGDIAHAFGYFIFCITIGYTKDNTYKYDEMAITGNGKFVIVLLDKLRGELKFQCSLFADTIEFLKNEMDEKCRETIAEIQEGTDFDHDACFTGPLMCG